MNAVQPLYFGTSEARLFGCYHAPEPGAKPKCAVVFCYPMGHEYIQFHRACRRLAELLARAGFPVLRFDFYGCGDSAGDYEEGRIQCWLEDIAGAISELRNRSASDNICLMGLRLGASLAAIAGAGRADIDGMVLWDPVVSGKLYLEELKSFHHEMLSRAHLRPVQHQKTTEIAGFVLTDLMIADLSDLDLLRIQRKPANNVLVVESREQLMDAHLVRHLAGLKAGVRHTHLPNPQFWTWIEDFSQILVPQQLLRAMLGWMSEVYP
jgi:exosortase A-associated hydrolase 2